jgi:hypothetical protein
MITPPTTEEVILDENALAVPWANDSIFFYQRRHTAA